MDSANYFKNSRCAGFCKFNIISPSSLIISPSSSSRHFTHLNHPSKSVYSMDTIQFNLSECLCMELEKRTQLVVSLQRRLREIQHKLDTGQLCFASSTPPSSGQESPQSSSSTPEQALCVFCFAATPTLGHRCGEKEPLLFACETCWENKCLRDLTTRSKTKCPHCQQEMMSEGTIRVRHLMI